MGYKHPLSLKLRKLENWSKIIYKFQKEKELNFINIEKIWNKIISLYFQNYITSKPNYIYKFNIKNRINGIKILLYIYIKPILKDKNILNNRKKKINISEINKLEKILEKIYLTTAKGLINNNINNYSFVNIEIIEINKPYINSEILGKYIIINLKRYTLKKIWRILEFSKIVRINPINKNFLTYNYNNLKYLALGKVIKSYIIGIKIIINGRLMKRKTASRSKKVILTYGKLKINSLSSLIDITSSETILNSKIGIKVLISNIIKLN